MRSHWSLAYADARLTSGLLFGTKDCKTFSTLLPSKCKTNEVAAARWNIIHCANRVVLKRYVTRGEDACEQHCSNVVFDYLLEIQIFNTPLIPAVECLATVYFVSAIRTILILKTIIKIDVFKTKKKTFTHVYSITPFRHRIVRSRISSAIKSKEKNSNRNLKNFTKPLVFLGFKGTFGNIFDIGF